MSFGHLHRSFEQFLGALQFHGNDGHTALRSLHAGLQKRWAPIERLISADADPLLVRDLVRTLPPVERTAHNHGLPTALHAKAGQTATAVLEAATALVPLSLDWSPVDIRTRPDAIGANNQGSSPGVTAALEQSGARTLQGIQAELAGAFVRSISNHSDMDCGETTHVLVERMQAQEWKVIVARLRKFFVDASAPLCLWLRPDRLLVASAGLFFAALETQPWSSLEDFRLFDQRGRCVCFWSEFDDLSLWQPRHVQNGRTLV